MSANGVLAMVFLSLGAAVVWLGRPETRKLIEIPGTPMTQFMGIVFMLLGLLLLLGGWARGSFSAR